MREKWTGSKLSEQRILFDEYPDLEKLTTYPTNWEKIYNQKIKNPL